jgi:hypothetical protein
MEIARGSYKKDGYDKGIRGKGYIVSALEAALWAFWSDKDSFKDGALAAVNLGDDTDTTAAIYGQLAGAHYGFRKLPEKWAEQIYAKKFIECLSKWIVYEGKTWSLKRQTAPTIPTVIVQSPCKVGGVSPFEQKTNSSMQSWPTENQMHGSKPFENNQTGQMESISTSEQSSDPKSDFRPRRYTVHDRAFALQPNPHKEHRSNSAEKQNPTSSSERKDFKFLIRQHQ